MKTKWIMAALCSVVLVLISCDKQSQTPEPPVVSPQPPYISISGRITNSDGQPLDSIQVMIEKNDSWWWHEHQLYSDTDGIYSFDSQYELSSDWTHIEWPSEVTVTTHDLAGIYESRTQTFPVQLTIRYPETPELKGYIDGIVSADFVLHKL